MKKWKVIKSERLFKSPWMKIRKDKVLLPSGKILNDYYMWEQGDVVIIIPYLDDGKVLLVSQYKHAVGEAVIEFPGGYVEENEEPRVAAGRELLEETGLKSTKFEKVAVLSNDPTKIIGKIFVYRALDCIETGKAKLDETEDIEVIRKTTSEVLAMIKNAEIWIAGSVSAGLIEFTLNQN